MNNLLSAIGACLVLIIMAALMLIGLIILIPLGAISAIITAVLFLLDKAFGGTTQVKEKGDEIK